MAGGRPTSGSSSCGHPTKAETAGRRSSTRLCTACARLIGRTAAAARWRLAAVGSGRARARAPRPSRAARPLSSYPSGCRRMVGICQSSGRRNAIPDSAAAAHGTHGGTKTRASRGLRKRHGSVAPDCWIAARPFLCPGPGMPWAKEF
jgi:hypothetical protein